MMTLLYKFFSGLWPKKSAPDETKNAPNRIPIVEEIEVVEPYPEVTLQQLREVMAPSPSKATRYIESLNVTMKKYEINTRLRQAHFLAQILHESGYLRYNKEIWGPTAQQRRYEPVTTLSQKLGNTEPGDGFRFRGRGLIQLTGRYNYQTYGEFLGKSIEETIEFLDTVAGACDVAGHYWSTRNINELADQDDIEAVTKKINGGLNGLNKRKSFLTKAKRVFNI